MTRVNLIPEKFLRILLVIFVLINVVVPSSLAGAYSVGAGDILQIEEQKVGFWEQLSKGFFQTLSCATSGDLTIANGETCSLAAGTYTYTSVTVQTGGTLILLGNTTLHQGVTINAGSVTVENGGKISANGNGYQGTTGSGAGPGGGQVISSGQGPGGGAGHGGTGETTGGNGGVAYGSVTNPTALGSSGGCGRYLISCRLSGAGGGAIRLNVENTLRVDGEIAADGVTPVAGRSGGGSGGSIYVTTGNLTGSGTIHANGGSGGNENGGDGAGGRIAVYYTASTFALDTRHVFARGAFTQNSNGGGPGTVYLKDLFNGADRLLVSNNGNSVTTYAVHLSGTFAYDRIELIEKGTLRVTGSGSTLTIKEDTLVGDGSGKLEVEGLVLAPETLVITNLTLEIRGNLQGAQIVNLQNGGALALYATSPLHSGSFSFTEILVGSGATLQLVSRGNGNTNYTDDPPLTLSVSKLTVASGGRILANGTGYPGIANSTSGPGGGAPGGSSTGGGGGHGGSGKSAAGAGGVTYGSVNLPILPGSSGGGGGDIFGGRTPGGSGGGAMRLIVSNTITVNGEIAANGVSGGGRSGGGSGGSILIETATLTGSGTIRAVGGAGRDGAGSGGGGRIAVYAGNSNHTITFSISGGTGWENDGEGTLYLHEPEVVGDLSLSMFAPANAVRNSAINYTITVQQSNEALAENVTLELQLPADVGYVSQNSPVEPLRNGQMFTWDLGTFSAGQNFSFVVTGHVSAAATVGSTLNAQASVTSSTPEGNLGNNTSTIQTTVVDGHSFTASISPTSRLAAIGAPATYEINLKNTGLVQDTFTVSVNGLNSQWYTLPKTSVSLLPGGTAILPLTVQADTCSAAGSNSFEIEIASAANQQVATLPASISFQTSPQVSGLVPHGGQTLGSRDVTINWRSDVPTTGLLTIFPVGRAEDTLTLPTSEGNWHSVVVPNLERNATYEWFVEATSDCGATTLPQRAFTVGNGIVFVNRSKNVTIDRDYNQRVSISVRNDDNIAHTLTASIPNPNEDIFVNFVDSGSVDQTITLQPAETRQITVAINAQDAALHNYDLTASLVSDEGGAPIYDNMTLRLTVLSEGDFTIEEVAFDEVTLARTYVITNHGKPITDLALTAVDPETGAPARIFLQPNLDHARLASGQSIRVTAYPIFTAADAAAQASSPARLASPLPAVPPINFNLQATGAGVTRNLPGTTSCGGGRSIMPVLMQNCSMTFETSDWYCTNRPVIQTPFLLPWFISPDNVTSAILSIVYAPQSNVQPHNGVISFNGAEVGSYSSRIPSGQFSFNIPASSIQSSVAGSSLQTVQMNTSHPNRGHYVSATGYKLNVGISQATTYVCADSSAAAQLIVQQQYACSAAYGFNWLTDVYFGSVYSGGHNKTTATIKGVIDADGNISNISCTQKVCGDPINTKTGSSSFSLVDLSFPTSAGELMFQRSYSSATTDVYTDTLGYGWTHNHEASLIFSDDQNGMEGFVLFRSALGNLYLFKEEANGSFTPAPGVTATLTKSATVYTITSSDHGKIIFDLDGKLVAREDAQERAFEYVYDARDRLSRINADGGSRYIQIGYDSQDRIISVSDHASREVTFGYDANGDLGTFTDVLGQTWTYTYDSAHRMTEVRDPDGRETVRTEYDLQGRAYRQFDGAGNLLVMVIYHSDGSATIYDALNHAQKHKYNQQGIVTQSTNEVSQKETTLFDENFRPTSVMNDAGHTLGMTWSADGLNLLSKTDPANNTTRYAYDGLNNLTSTTDPLGNTTTYTYTGTLLASATDALGQATTYTYTPEGYLASMTDPLNRATTYTYDSHGQRISMTDPAGNTWGYTYDALGRLTHTSDPRGRVTFNEYNAAGQLLRAIQNYDPNRSQNDQNLYNLVTEYEYDPRGNQIAVTDTLGRVTHYEYDDADRLARTIDPAGNISTNTYDAVGRLVSSMDALGRATTYQYDPSGRLIKTINPLGVATGATTFNAAANTSTVKDAAGHAWIYFYDSLGRTVKVRDALGNESLTSYDRNGNVRTRTDPLGRVTTYEYDKLNRLVRTIDPNGGVTQTIYNTQGQRIATIDALGNTTTYTYDAQGRLTAATDPLGRVTRTEYDPYGRRAASIDAMGNRTKYAYDLLDRVIAAQDSLGNTTHTTYDALGNVLTRTDANGNVTAYTYDNLNRTVTVTDPNGYTATNTYNAVGNLTAVTNALGETSTYTYDALNRQIAVTDPLGHTTRTVYNSLGQISGTLDANGVVTRFEYDALGRQIAVVLNFKPTVLPDAETNVRYEYEYNAAGNRTLVRDPKGSVTTFAYDALNRVTGKTDPSTGSGQAALGNTWSYAYDLAGNQISMTDGKGQATNYVYDGAGQLTRIDYPAPEADVTFAYNLNGQRISMTDGLGTTSWSYDNLNRPVSVTDPHNNTLRFGYDAAGNRTLLTYPNNNAVSYGYDAAGRLVNVNDWSGQATAYAYDAAGRLTTISRPNGVTSAYGYDAAGRVAQLEHTQASSPLATYSYTYDPVGNLRQTVESILQPLPPTPTPTLTNTPTETATETPTETPTLTPTATDMPTETPTETATESPPQTATESPEETATETPTETATAEITATPTLTPADLLAALRASVDAYVSSGRIAPQMRNSLLGKLQNAAQRITDGQVNAAVNQLNAFINEVNAQRGKKIATAAADDLIAQAQAIINMLSALTPTPLPQGEATSTPELTSTPAEETPTPTETPLLTPTQLPSPTTTATETLTSTPTASVTHSPSLTPTETFLPTSTYTPLPTATQIPAAGPLTIAYTYDALRRLTSAAYSDGRAFSYVYDPNGNTLTYSEQPAPFGDFAVTSYQYDAANQLLTAQKGESLWHYEYDANGSLVEVLPNGNEDNGAKRYTYNTAGYLSQVETHNGSSWDLQAEMAYNGLGQRLSMDAAGVIAHYVMDGDRPLTADSSGNTTYYLYGLGVIGEETNALRQAQDGAWSYALTDGTNTQRQLTNSIGEVTYSARYTPWGDTLDTHGTGNFAFGYFGGVMDAATGLLGACPEPVEG